MVKGYHGKKTGIPPGATMNIIEGEFDPVTLVMTIISDAIIIGAMLTLTPYINDVVTSGLCVCP